MASQAEKAEYFAKMHDEGCFVLPNVWDFASVAMVRDAGYPVIATTSAGVAFAQGFPDGEAIGRDRMIELAGRMAVRFDMPVTADLEAGYGPEPADVAATIAQAIAAGVIGCNLEDGVPGSRNLADRELSAARIAAAAAAAEAAGLKAFSINARTDPFIRSFGTAEQCFNEAVIRGRMYLEAGARSVFIPGVIDTTTMAKLVAAIGGPVNVMAVGGGVMPRIADIQASGVRRVSLGGSWMSACYGTGTQVLQNVASGNFDYPEGLGYSDLMRMMAQ